jgi:hypothetical protein
MPRYNSFGFGRTVSSVVPSGVDPSLTTGSITSVATTPATAVRTLIASSPAPAPAPTPSREPVPTVSRTAAALPTVKTAEQEQTLVASLPSAAPTTFEMMTAPALAPSSPAPLAPAMTPPAPSPISPAAASPASLPASVTPTSSTGVASGGAGGGGAPIALQQAIPGAFPGQVVGGAVLPQTPWGLQALYQQPYPILGCPPGSVEGKQPGTCFPTTSALVSPNINAPQPVVRVSVSNTVPSSSTGTTSNKGSGSSGDASADADQEIAAALQPTAGDKVKKVLPWVAAAGVALWLLRR